MSSNRVHLNRKLTALGFVGSIFGISILLSYAQRLIYLVWILLVDGHLPSRLLAAFAKGLLFDLEAGFFMFIPVILLLAAAPRRFFKWKAFKSTVLTLTLIPLLVVSFSAIAELFFFDEFHSRYNFIAVDYLVYTHEVVNNIVESFTIFAPLGAALIPLTLLFIILRKLISRLVPAEPSTAQAVWARSIAAVVLLITITAWVSEDAMLSAEPYWARELSKNSIFALFSAYRRNSISYPEFYSSLESKNAMNIASNWLNNRPLDQAENLASGSPMLIREIKGRGPEKRQNVVLVAMESMSAAFLAHFGNKQPITANLDRLADSGMFFTQMYATGTRTVRGLEALMLSLPPTPGQSILRRPGSDGMFNIGTVFTDHGYKTQFIYGGYALFDNMKEWFSSNGFEVVDRSAFPAAEVQFANAWGVCDEDLFAQVLKQQEALVKAGTPFFQTVLTTSNHRPYTFPSGKIDLASGTGREAAIKYSDYAIGKFIEAAQTKPWFNNTIFIFVADHDASVAGGTDIPVHDYLIPAIIYSPQLIPPLKVEKLASQIDLAPTLLGLLNFSYSSKFFGQDLTTDPGGRALLGTYQKISMLRAGSLTVLSPGRSVETQELDAGFNVKSTSRTVTKDASLLSESARLTVAIYQSASELFTKGLLKARAVAQP